MIQNVKTLMVIQMQSIKRIYHPYWMWEETDNNMWGTVPNRAEYLDWAVEFTGDHEQYGSAMMGVVEEWRFSCEHNLTNLTQNRKAWIGHAACAYAKKCPEDIVRQAWSSLTKKQQHDANAVADLAIEHWESLNGEGVCLSLKLDLV